jgi:hypothetical protein
VTSGARSTPGAAAESLPASSARALLARVIAERLPFRLRGVEGTGCLVRRRQRYQPSSRRIAIGVARHPQRSRTPPANRTKERRPGVTLGYFQNRRQPAGTRRVHESEHTQSRAVTHDTHEAFELQADRVRKCPAVPAGTAPEMVRGGRRFESVRGLQRTGCSKIILLPGGTPAVERIQVWGQLLGTHVGPRPQRAGRPVSCSAQTHGRRVTTATTSAPTWNRSASNAGAARPRHPASAVARLATTTRSLIAPPRSWPQGSPSLAYLDVNVERLLGTQIRPSCCSGVFVDQSAESVAAAELVWRAWTDEA